MYTENASNSLHLELKKTVEKNPEAYVINLDFKSVTWPSIATTFLLNKLFSEAL